jgi:tRNA dimethylallyltransferase
MDRTGTELETDAPTRPILIAGPTASGKSALALRLAEETGGVIVNADAIEVYAELAILTARPGPDDLARAPHRLYAHVAASDAYSVQRWLADVRPLLAELADARRPPILVGGTGLYLTALTEGLSAVPPVDPAVRARWRAAAAKLGGEALHGELAARDPVMAARLRPSDPQRIVRALEVIEATGRSLADWQREASPPIVPLAGARALVVAPERAALRARIEHRFRAMLAAGALDEARAVAALGLDPSLPAMKARGLRPLIAHLADAMMLEDAIAAAVTETRRYAKRQETWFRNRFASWERVAPPWSA